MSKKHLSLWEILFGTKSKKNSANDENYYTECCDECGEYFEDCECNCDDEDCHNEGGW